MPGLILQLTDDERDQRDKMIFECTQSPLALEQLITELLVLRKLKTAVKATTRQTPKVRQVLARFPTKSAPVAEKCEPDLVERLQPIDEERRLWWVES